MINKVQPVKSLRSITFYLRDAYAHDGSDQRYLMARGYRGVSPHNMRQVMGQRLREVGRGDGRGITALSWLHSFDRSEFDPDDPDQIEAALELVFQASIRRNPASMKTFFAQADGASGLLHVHEVELNALDADVEVTTTQGTRARKRSGLPDPAEQITTTRTVREGHALPKEYRDVYRCRAIANDVYAELTGRSNPDLMAERRTGKTMTAKASMLALVDHLVSQPTIKAGGFDALTEAMRREGYDLATRGKSQSWKTISETGATQSWRLGSLPMAYSRDSLVERLAVPEPVLSYPPRLRLNRAQLERKRLAAEAEQERERQAHEPVMKPPAGSAPLELEPVSLEGDAEPAPLEVVLALEGEPVILRDADGVYYTDDGTLISFYRDPVLEDDSSWWHVIYDADGNVIARPELAARIERARQLALEPADAPDDTPTPPDQPDDDAMTPLRERIARHRASIITTRDATNIDGLRKASVQNLETLDDILSATPTEVTIRAAYEWVQEREKRQQAAVEARQQAQERQIAIEVHQPDDRVFGR